MPGPDAHRANAKIGWILASIAVVFFLGVIARYILFGRP
jgi:TRAP-type C4-dicarboxylate transport system permease small subunit